MQNKNSQVFEIRNKKKKTLSKFINTPKNRNTFLRGFDKNIIQRKHPKIQKNTKASSEILTSS